MTTSRFSLSLVALSFALATSAASVACSDSEIAAGDAGTAADSSTGDAAADATSGDGGGDAGATDSSDAAALCTTLTSLGGQVALEVIGGTAPTPVGGSVSDGTYVLTSAKIYAGGDAGGGTLGSVAATIRLTGSKYELATESGGKSETASGSFVANGTGLTLTDACPKAEVNVGQYSVGMVAGGTTPTLTLLSPVNGKTLVQIYEKK